MTTFDEREKAFEKVFGRTLEFKVLETASTIASSAI